MSRELLFSLTHHDFEMQTFRSGGKGGQNQNKTNSGVRFIHHPSGARGESREYREQLRNKKAAFNRLVTSPTFQKWVKQQVAIQEIGEQEIERRVDEAMREKNLKIEVGHFE